VRATAIVVAAAVGEGQEEEGSTVSDVGGNVCADTGRWAF
jgi:hypothetical protein